MGAYPFTLSSSSVCNVNSHCAEEMSALEQKTFEPANFPCAVRGAAFQPQTIQRAPDLCVYVQLLPINP